jgi:hypothetical protein
MHPQLHYREFFDGVKKIFCVVEEHPLYLVLQQDTGEYWTLTTPRSLQEVIDNLKRDRKLGSIKGLILTGHMPGGSIARMKWSIE